jgi:hypothetical protein
MTHLPVEDPYDQGSLAERSREYVRASPALRIALIATAIDHVAAIALVAIKRVSLEIAGAFALFSVLAWFFAVCMPVMNRTVRAHLGATEAGYWNEVLEMFFRVLLCTETALYTAAVIYGAAFGVGA